jgi:hypothetical protein
MLTQVGQFAIAASILTAAVVLAATIKQTSQYELVSGNEGAVFACLNK